MFVAYKRFITSYSDSFIHYEFSIPSNIYQYCHSFYFSVLNNYFVFTSAAVFDSAFNAVPDAAFDFPAFNFSFTAVCV